jgi:hypothetical protein
MSWTGKPQRAGAVETSYTINETFTPPAASAITTVPIDLPSRSETGETKIELIRLLGSPPLPPLGRFWIRRTSRERLMLSARLQHGDSAHGLRPRASGSARRLTMAPNGLYKFLAGVGFGRQPTLLSLLRLRAHGDAIDYVMRAGNLDFIDAIKRLAGEAGMAVP